LPVKTHKQLLVLLVVPLQVLVLLLLAPLLVLVLLLLLLLLTLVVEVGVDEGELSTIRQALQPAAAAAAETGAGQARQGRQHIPFSC
jgi:hypothetical protein